MSSQNDKAKTWRHRRQMAFISLFWLIIEILLVFFVIPESKLELLEEVIVFSLFTFGGIVAAYCGFKAFGKDEMKK